LVCSGAGGTTFPKISSMGFQFSPAGSPAGGLGRGGGLSKKTFVPGGGGGGGGGPQNKKQQIFFFFSTPPPPTSILSDKGRRMGRQGQKKNRPFILQKTGTKGGGEPGGPGFVGALVWGPPPLEEF